MDFDVLGNNAFFNNLEIGNPVVPIIEATPAASVVITPQALNNGVQAILAESQFNSQGSGIHFNASNQIVVENSGFYIIWANILTTRSGGATTTGYISIWINGVGGNGVDAYSSSNTNEEIASAVFIGFITADSTIEVATTVFNANVSVTRGALGIAIA